MFFFGAFSGNFLYLILAISYLAGFSALAFRTPEVQPKEQKSADPTTGYILHNNQLQKSATYFYIKDTVHNAQSVNFEVVIQSPLTSFFAAFFIPPPFAGYFQFSRAALFARPPPFFLV